MFNDLFFDNFIFGSFSSISYSYLFKFFSDLYVIVVYLIIGRLKGIKRSLG